jgi:hypothetical protein
MPEVEEAMRVLPVTVEVAVHLVMEVVVEVERGLVLVVVATALLLIAVRPQREDLIAVASLVDC